MNKLIKTLLITAILIPQLTFGAVSVGWNSPSATTGWILPNLVNGVDQAINAVAGIFTNASSTFSGAVRFPSLSDGCLYLSSGVLTSNVANPTCTAGGGGSGTGTVSTSTPLVSGQVDFSTSASTIGNDSTFLFDTTLKRLTAQNASTTAFSVSGAAYIPKLSNLTTNGFVKTSSSDGTLSIDTSTYLTAAITALGPLNQTQTGATQTLATSTTGTDFTITASGNTQTVNLPVASAVNTGKLSSTDWSTFNGKQVAGNYITALTGDVTATGPGSVAATLATVNGNVGSFTNSSITVNGKGLITAASSGSAPEVPLTFTWPLIRTTNTISFGGLSTSSAAVLGNIPYFSGVNTFANVATSSLAIGASLSNSGTLGSQIGGTASSLSINLSNPNSWVALQTFANSSTTLGSFGYSSSTLSSIGTLTLPGITGTQCLHSISGVVSGTGADCGSGSGGTDPFTHPGVGFSATTSSVLIGTSTTGLLPTLTLASSTAPQLVFSAGAGLQQYAFRNAGGNLYLSTTTVAGTATSSTSVLSVVGSLGSVGIGTNSPADVNANSKLTVAGFSAVDIIASTTDNTTLSTAIVEAYAPGSRVFLGAHGTNQVATQYGITSGGWGELGAINSTFGSSNGLMIGTRTTNTPIVFGTNSLERMRITGAGFTGIGTTTPQWLLHLSTSTAPQLTLTDGDTSAGFAFRTAGAWLYLATTSPTTYATSTPGTAFSINGAAGAKGLFVGTTTSASFNTDMYVYNENATSTITIDTNSITKGSCIIMKDTDGVGYTYVKANNGVLTASTVDCR